MDNKSVNQHISAEEREKWNSADQKIREHISEDSGLHIPSPPEEGNYYLGSDLQWHKMPVVSIE